MKVYSLRSWRPLHRLRGPPPPLWQGRLEIRSVPLRGYGFEITFLIVDRAQSIKFPSPCGDMVLKLTIRFFIYRCIKISFRPLAGFLLLSFPRRYGGSGEHSEPMGALVPCDHFCRYEGLQLAFMAPPPPLTRSPSPALAGEAGGTLRPLAGIWF